MLLFQKILCILAGVSILGKSRIVQTRFSVFAISVNVFYPSAFSRYRDRVGSRAGATDGVRRAQNQIARAPHETKKLHENAASGVAARVRRAGNIERDSQIGRKYVPVLHSPKSETKTGKKSCTAGRRSLLVRRFLRCDLTVFVSGLKATISCRAQNQREI